MRYLMLLPLALVLGACTNDSTASLTEENKKLKAEVESLRQQLAHLSGSPSSADSTSTTSDNQFVEVDWKDLIAFQKRYQGKQVKVPMQFQISHIGGDAPSGHFFMLILIPGDGGSRFTYWPESLYPKFKGKEGRTFKANIFANADIAGNGVLGLAIVKYENGKFF